MIVTNALTQLTGYIPDTGGKEELGKSDFLMLMISQLQNQDPLDPMKNEDFIAQLAQFNSLEQMINLNQTMASLGNLQILSQTASLVGRNIEALDDSGASISGTVTAVEFKDGLAKLVIQQEDGTEYRVTIDRILSVN